MMRLEQALVPGNALLLPVDLNTAEERGNDTYESLPLHPVKVRPVVIWQVQKTRAGWIVDVVPLSSSRARHGHGVRVDRLPGINCASTHTMDRIVRLHPSLVESVEVVGHVGQDVLDALARLLVTGHLEDLTLETGDRAPRLDTITGWNRPARHLEETRRRHDGHTRRSPHRRTRHRQHGDLPVPQNVLRVDEALRLLQARRSRMHRAAMS